MKCHTLAHSETLLVRLAYCEALVNLGVSTLQNVCHLPMLCAVAVILSVIELVVSSH